MKFLIFLPMLCCIISPPIAHAEEKENEKQVEKGELLSRYWLEDPLTFGAVLALPNHLFSISGNGVDIDYAPAQVTDLTLSLGYGPFNFSWKFPLPQSASSKNTYGKSSYDDFTFEYCRERWAASAYYQSFSGFFTDLNGHTSSFARIGSGNEQKSSSTFESTGSSSTTTPAEIVKRPDIHTKHYGAIGWHSFPIHGEGDQAFKISFRGLTDKPSEGYNLDLVTSAFLDRTWIEAGLPFVPAKKSSAFQQGAKLQGIETNSVGFGVGLATSYVFENTKHFLDLLLLIGGGAQKQKLSYSDDTRWHLVYVDNFNFRMGYNYRGDSQNFGVHFWVNTLGSKAEDARVNSSNMAMELSYTYTI